MLLVEVLIADEEGYSRLVEIVRGEEVHPERKLPQGGTLAHVLMTEEQYAEAVRNGYECRVVTDYSKLPDPRDEVSKSNRFEEDLEKLRDKRTGR